MPKKTDRVLVVVPARMASSRYPGKPLVMILGLPMVEHVRRRALLAKGVDEVLVATCDLEIKRVVESFGGKAVMTSDKHERCTERVAEAAQNFSARIVVNVQGDEPLLSPKHIETTLEPFQYPEVSAVSLLSPIRTEEDRNSPGVDQYPQGEPRGWHQPSRFPSTWVAPGYYRSKYAPSRPPPSRIQ